jgi:antitoxin component YwqK of YwqJK toxin-antitoxin module
VLVHDGDRLRITRYYDNGKVMRTGTYVEAPLGWQPYLIEGIEESYEPDGTLESRQTYSKGVRQGPAVEFVKRDGQRYRHESDWNKDAVVRERIYLGDTLIEESEYFPDGSTKSHKEYKQGAQKTGI